MHAPGAGLGISAWEGRDVRVLRKWHVSCLQCPLQKYEPYTIMLRKHVPWYDERFRGYHFNKIVGELAARL